jgi:AraC-like DNA-binding protein
MEGIQKGLPVNWADLAADCGYFDQAHLIRDFRAFAGITPRAYSRALTDVIFRSAHRYCRRWGCC